MKTTILKSVLIVLMSLVSFNTYGVEINGIYYVLNEENQTAEVTQGDYKFTNEIIIPESVTYNSINYSVTSIGSSAFQDCSDLNSVTISESVTSIGNRAFENCNNLTSVTISESVTSIGESAFYRCTSLTSLIIPNSVTSIGVDAFKSCWRLKDVTIGNSVASIGEDAFRGCYNVTSIVVESENNTYDSRDNCNAIIETATNTLLRGCINTDIPNSVESIGDHAFEGCSNLTSVTIPNSVTSIGKDVFYECI